MSDVQFSEAFKMVESIPTAGNPDVWPTLSVKAPGNCPVLTQHVITSSGTQQYQNVSVRMH